MKKTILTILGMILIASLVSAQDITLNGNVYTIGNYTYDEYMGYCLEFQGISDKQPCSVYTTEFKGNLIFNETAMTELEYILYCWDNDCQTEDNPFYISPLTLNNLNESSKEDNEIIVEDNPTSWLDIWTKIKQIINRLTGAEDRITILEQELCKKDNSYSFCLGGIAPK